MNDRQASFVWLWEMEHLASNLPSMSYLYFSHPVWYASMGSGSSKASAVLVYLRVESKLDNSSATSLTDTNNLQGLKQRR